jgi:putative NIF3 family GTP cyclohydrolase 1 type 2
LEKSNYPIFAKINFTMKDYISFKNTRRNFLLQLSLVTGGQLIAMPLFAKSINSNQNNTSNKTVINNSDTITVGQIIDTFISEVPSGKLKETVDTLKAGSLDTQVKGIVTTMFATVEVIKKSIAIGANLIIAHEPTFYSHQDKTDWLEKDATYEYKKNLLKDNNITVWRCHDYIHKMTPDPVTMGVLNKMGWEDKMINKIPNLIQLSNQTLKDIIFSLKSKMGVDELRYMGSLTEQTNKILFIPGAAGSTTHIAALKMYKPDVLICGEVEEWTTVEYIRDTRSRGESVSLILLGHIASEEPSASFMLGWVKERFPAIASKHIPAGNSLSFL